MRCKNDKHDLLVPADRINGECRKCLDDRQDAYRRRRRLAMALLKVAEGRGLSGSEAIAVLQNVDYWTLQECQSMGIRAE